MDGPLPIEYKEIHDICYIHFILIIFDTSRERARLKENLHDCKKLQ